MKKFLDVIKKIWIGIEKIQTERAEQILANYRGGIKRWE